MKDPRWIFGFALLFIIAFLSARVALGHVEQATSYGLDILLGGLINMAGAFGNWAFSGSKPTDKIQEKQ
jgi:hypothetical protein